MTRFSVRYEFLIDNGGFHDVSPSNLNALIGAMGVLTEELMGFGAWFESFWKTFDVEEIRMPKILESCPFWTTIKPYFPFAWLCWIRDFLPQFQVAFWFWELSIWINLIFPHWAFKKKKKNDMKSRFFNLNHSSWLVIHLRLMNAGCNRRALIFFLFVFLLVRRFRFLLLWNFQFVFEMLERLWWWLEFWTTHI